MFYASYEHQYTIHVSDCIKIISLRGIMETGPVCYQWRWSIQKCCTQTLARAPRSIFSISLRLVELITEMAVFWTAKFIPLNGAQHLHRLLYLNRQIALQLASNSLIHTHMRSVGMTIPAKDTSKCGQEESGIELLTQRSVDCTSWVQATTATMLKKIE